jgi:hypothetical protein
VHGPLGKPRRLPPRTLLDPRERVAWRAEILESPPTPSLRSPLNQQRPLPVGVVRDTRNLETFGTWRRQSLQTGLRFVPLAPHRLVRYVLGQIAQRHQLFERLVRRDLAVKKGVQR